MRTQIWIIGAAFAVFGVIAWVATFYSPVYVGLILMGLILIVVGFFSSPQ